MASEAKKLGEIFKNKREELDLSLKDVESATNIRTTHLEAIEEGIVENFLSKVYMYGFMRQYARYLHLDMEKLARDFPDTFAMTSSSPSEFTFGIGTLEMRKKITAKKGKTFTYVIWGIGLAATFLLAWIFAKYMQIF